MLNRPLQKEIARLERSLLRGLGNLNSQKLGTRLAKQRGRMQALADLRYRAAAEAR